MNNDSNPCEQLLRQEFKQRLKGLMTHRQLRQAMLHATDITQLKQLVALTKEIEDDGT